MDDLMDLVRTIFRRANNLAERLEFWFRCVATVVLFLALGAFIASWYGQLKVIHVAMAGGGLIFAAFVVLMFAVRPFWLSLLGSAILRRFGKIGTDVDRTIRNGVALRIVFVVMFDVFLGACLVAFPVRNAPVALLFWVLGTLSLMLGTVASPKTVGRRAWWIIAVIFVLAAAIYSGATNEDSPSYQAIRNVGEFFEPDEVVVTIFQAVPTVEVPAFEPTPLPEAPPGYYLHSWERIPLGDEYTKGYSPDGPTEAMWGTKTNPVCQPGEGFWAAFNHGADEVPYLVGGPDVAPSSLGLFPPVAFKAAGGCPEILLYVIAPLP